MDCWVRLNFSANACWLKHCGDNSYVVSVKSAKDINITECDLYGCGNNYIYSSEPLVEIEYQKNMNNMKRVEFKNCKIFNNHSSDFTRDEAAVKLENCIMSDNTWEEKSPQAYGICLNGITWQVDGENLKIGYPLLLSDGTVIESARGQILEYSDSSLPWKKYLDKKQDINQGVWYKVNVDDKFIDIPSDVWYTSAVQYVYERGIMTGKSEDTFDPEAADHGTINLCFCHKECFAENARL